VLNPKNVSSVPAPVLSTPKDILELPLTALENSIAEPPSLLLYNFIEVGSKSVLAATSFLISNFALGEVVPIPTFPVADMLLAYIVPEE
jgi:hypothetical protein